MRKKGWDDKIAATALQLNTFPLFWSGGCKHNFIKTEISATSALHINDDRNLLMENIDAGRPTHLQCSAFRYAVSSLADKMNLAAAFATTHVQLEFCRHRIKTMFVKKILERSYVPVRR